MLPEFRSHPEMDLVARGLASHCRSCQRDDGEAAPTIDAVELAQTYIHR